jgi:hypothetical protein
VKVRAMNTLNYASIKELVKHESGQPCVSLFLPTHPGSREQRQDAIRLRNMADGATEKLIAQGLRRPDATRIAQKIEGLSQDAEFWGQRSAGMSCFAAGDFFAAYHVPVRLEERLVVGERFSIKPLLPLLHADARFFVLALTQDSARLFEATEHAMRELELPEIALVEVDGADRTLQYHSQHAPAIGGQGGRSEAIFHGHGGPADRAKPDMSHFFGRVDDAVRKLLPNDRSPLVLACVGYLAPLYESASSHTGLLTANVSGSPERMPLDELRQRAWETVEPHFRQHQDQAISRFRENRNDRTSDDIRQVVLSAEEGRVDTLFIKPRFEQWGRVDFANLNVELVDSNGDGEIGKGQVDLLDFAASRTLANRGEVFAVNEIPDTTSPVAAILRW